MNIKLNEKEWYAGQLALAYLKPQTKNQNKT
jgi:hypothetical protein